MQPEDTIEATKATRKKPRYFYGWNIVGASFLAHLSYAEHHSSVLGFFMRPLNQEFGWSRTQVALVQTIARFVEAGVSFYVGPLIDKHGPRYLMPIGAMIVGFAMMATTQVNAIWQFWLLRGVVVAVGFTLMGHMVTNVTINKWFTRKRGRAIALAGVGSNLGNVIMTPVTVWVLAISVWQTSFVIFAVVTWVVVLVPSLVLMRRQPEDMGLHPDGDDPAEADTRVSESEEQDIAASVAAPVMEAVWSRREIVGTSAFWLLICSISVANLAFQGINISLAPYMQDLHYADALVATVVTFRAIVMAVTLPAWGFIGERSHIPWIRIAPFLLQGLGAVFFIMAENQVFLWLAVIVYGVGFGGVMVIQEVLWANYFRRFSLGLVRSTGFPIIFAFSASGPIFMNIIFDVIGSYRPAYITFIGFYAVAAVLLWMVRGPTPLRFTTAEDQGFAGGTASH
jgi:OFA family oxalate/formate antiporter-like MFS transporter